MSNPRKKIKITPTDFFLKEWWSDLKIISSDGMELYVSKYQLAANSPFFNRIFTEDPECKELKINYNNLDICRWLKAFHKSNKHKCKIPECNIGAFIMLCNQYEMKELEEIGLGSIDKVFAKSNIDVIEYASKTTIFDSKIHIITQWLINNKFTKKELTNINKKFIWERFTKHIISQWLINNKNPELGPIKNIDKEYILECFTKHIIGKWLINNKLTTKKELTNIDKEFILLCHILLTMSQLLITKKKPELGAIKNIDKEFILECFTKYAHMTKTKKKLDEIKKDDDYDYLFIYFNNVFIVLGRCTDFGILLIVFIAVCWCIAGYLNHE